MGRCKPYTPKHGFPHDAARKPADGTTVRSNPCLRCMCLQAVDPSHECWNNGNSACSYCRTDKKRCDDVVPASGLNATLAARNAYIAAPSPALSDSEVMPSSRWTAKASSSRVEYATSVGGALQEVMCSRQPETYGFTMSCIKLKRASDSACFARSASMKGPTGTGGASRGRAASRGGVMCREGGNLRSPVSTGMFYVKNYSVPAPKRSKLPSPKC